MIEKENTLRNKEDLKLYRGLLLVTLILYPIFGLVNVYVLPEAHEDTTILIQRCVFSLLIGVFLILSYKSEVIAKKFYLVISSFVYLGMSHLLLIGYLKGFYIDHLAGILLVLVGTSLVFRRHAHLNYYLIYVALAITFVAHFAPKTELSPIIISAVFISIALVLFIGINSKIRAEIRLRHNEANLTALTENTSDMIWSISTKYMILTANSMARKVLGKIGIEAIPGKYLEISKYPDFNRADWKGYYQRALDGEIFKVVRYNPESGLTYEHSFYPIKNRSGKVKGTCVYSRDISSLVEKERNLSGAQKLAKIGSFSRNFKTGVYTWSDYMYELFQVSKEEDLSKLDMKQYIYADDYESYESKFKELLLIKNEFSLKYRIVRLNKTVIPVLSNIIVKKNELGEIIEFNGTIQDISEQFKAEQLERENIELQKEKELIELATKQHEQFLANMSHEIRTPMNAIVGISNLVTHSGNLDVKTREYMNAIKTNSRNLLRIINDVLDFSNINSGTFEKHQLNFELNEFMYSTIELVQDKCQEKGLEINVFIDEGLSTNLSGDVLRTTQILSNLLNNSVKFTNVGKIVFSAEKSNKKSENGIEWIDFKVIDTGVGIPEEKLERVFDTFFQLHAEDQTKNTGTGLGLSIVKRITEALGGEVILNSWENIGTEVIISLPFNQRSEHIEIGDKNFNEVKILLVEDNHFNQMVAEETIKSWNEKVIVDIAENGKIALEKLQENEYTLILMDIQMPVLDGHETTKQIRATFQEPKKSIPIIAVTAHAFKEEIENCFKSGMNDYISKPYESDDLINKISKYISISYNNDISNDKNVTESISSDIEKIVNIQSILDFTKGKKERIVKMVEMFLNETPIELDKMIRLFNEGNFTQLKTLAHSFKPKFTYLGMPQFSEIAKQIENLSVDAKNEEEINNLITELNSEIEMAYKELSDFLTSL